MPEVTQLTVIYALRNAGTEYLFWIPYMTDLFLSDWACVPPCKTCKDQNHCPDVHLIVPPPPPLDGPFLPGDLDPVKLVCGHSVPWPIISLLGSHGQQVWCEQHGYCRVSTTQIKTSQKKLRERKKNANTGQLEIDDIPPF